MAKKKQDLSLVVWVFGWLLALATALKKFAATLNVPFEAFERLGSDQGEATIGKIVQLIHSDWLDAQPKSRVQTGSPYRGGVPSGESRDRITVTAPSAAGLIKLAKKQLSLTYLDGDLAKWDFVTDECGKTYEVQSWKPGREVVPATEVREHFKDGFVGNTAAFIALMTRDNPEGYHASIPADDRLFQSGGLLYAPYFLRDECDRKLGLRHDVRDRWRDDMCFWAFREFKNA
ncbi:MAG: hypothetical protein WCK01_04225 [Candidatus Uhrbacteria bacterium]